MNFPNVEDVVNHLSIKFNKIFCEREFVSCVIQDFQLLLTKTNKPCVLVFPALGPIYLKAVRYQAKIFDLASFPLKSNKFKTIAVCHKDTLLKKSNETTIKEEIMNDLTTITKRKRPERELYIPPAQRRTQQNKTKIVQKTKRSNCELNNNNNNLLTTDYCDKSVGKLSLNELNHIIENINFYQFGLKHTKLIKNAIINSRLNSVIETNYYFKCNSILIYNNFKFSTYVWKTEKSILFKNYKLKYLCSPCFDFSLDNLKNLPKLECVFNINDTTNTEDTLSDTEYLKNGVYTTDYKPENGDIFNTIDLYELGHFYIVKHEGIEYCFECCENHNIAQCIANKIEELNNEKLVCDNKDKCNSCKLCQLDKIKLNNDDKTNNQINVNEKKIENSKNEHEQEKEIMRKTKENINRRTKPLMKYVDNSNDTLRIDKNDSINNWEDLFTDDGQIQEELLSEIVDKVGPEVTIVKANEDYTAYTNKPPENLEHVVELYNFPASLETRDLVQAFSEINSDAMYIKWVDDTHALLVLGSLSQAQKAMNMSNPLIKVRPMTAASAISMDVANKSDLKPAMKRPQTNLQTARRLITTHLGTKSKLTKEQIAKEKQDLKNAKEMKRVIKQNEKDAWEGNIKSAVK